VDLDLVAQALEVQLGRPDDVLLGLVPVRVEVLAKVALAVQQGHGDHRQAHVGGAAQGVAREHAEAAGVGGDLARKRDLHREVGDQVLRGRGNVVVVVVINPDNGFLAKA
jgi:hypothetical protein